MLGNFEDDTWKGMKKTTDFFGLANTSLLHELEQKLDQQAVLRMTKLHKQLKYKRKSELVRIKKQILRKYNHYSHADYLYESVLLEIEIRLHKLSFR
jgi:hypothetical protein